MTIVPASRDVKSPEALVLLIREIKEAVAAGVLEQIRPDPSPFASDVAIEDVANTGPWMDYLEIRFRQRDSGRHYKLSVETYHGAGGTWAPE